MQIEHKKNTAYYLAFPMVDSASPASFKSSVSPVDTAYYKDGAGAWTSLAITDTASEIASTGVYEIDLTAAELNHDQVIIKFAVSGAADSAFLFDMRTELAEDLGDGSGGVSLANGAITDASLAGNMEIVFETDFATNYNATRNAWATNVQDFVGTSAADPFNGQVVAASVTAGVTLANGAITDASLAGNMEIVFETDFGTNYNATRNAWVTNAQDFVGTTAADPFNGQVVAASVTGAVGSVTGAVASVTGNVGGNVVGSVASVTAGVTLANGAITDASLAGNMEIVFETDFATNYNAARNAWATNVQDFVGTSGADPFNGTVVAASVTGAVGSVTGAVGSVAGNVDGNVTGSIGALTSAAIADVWSTDTLTEAYTTDGSDGTPAQLLYDILQSLTEFAISSTTLTVKKRDGSTTAATYTLDSDTVPTSRTRAT